MEERMSEFKIKAVTILLIIVLVVLYVKGVIG